MNKRFSFSLNYSILTRTLTSLFIILISIIAFNNSGFAQRIVGYTDNFENGTLEFNFSNNQGNRPPFVIWGTETNQSYGLSESDGVLKINYSRKAGMGAFDHFTFHTFRGINVENNPRIQVDVKSEIASRLTVSPTYSLDPPTFEYLEKEIPGDNTWHTYTFNLTPAYYKNRNISAVDFYLDRGLAEEKTGKIEIDNFRMAWYLIDVVDVQAKVVNGQNIELNWTTSNTERTAGYKIYRSYSSDFEPGGNNFLVDVSTTSYTDTNLEPYKHYFYKVVAVGKSGEVFFASEKVSGETFVVGNKPSVKVSVVNNSTIKKYEKFEINLNLKNVGIENPYDPKDIDVYAIIKSPSGKEIKVNGFYDNYLEKDQWKLRFSPNETGEYSYQVFVKDVGGTGQTEVAKFNAVDSEHRGWIKPSLNNPHYFQHDDGSTFYAIGVYSPWRNNLERFETFAKNGANLLGIWDITYGGFVNETGLIEEELGRYNQLKLGRIDSMLSILEKDDIKVMYAIWPHDLFSETVWAAEWKNNPYSQLIDVDDVYSDSLVWEYQKQKYRYLIARFAHSRSWGIWELINEMNGTDGWEHGRQEECYAWVEKSSNYFKENDPYNHPTTASFSGGFKEYRKPLYERNDIPNIHMYPAQGWEMKYPNDTMRSGVYNYAWASQRFWKDFEKPAIFGESGANLEYYQPRDPNYHIHYHNTLWATLSNGLAGIPVWWDYPVLNEQDWQQLKIVSEFVTDIDFASEPFKPAKCAAEGADFYVMDSGKNSFGWARSYTNINSSGMKLTFSKPGKATYSVLWFDTWTGETLKTETVNSKNDELTLIVPALKTPHPDIAFKITKR